jgi:hypothetical protein
MAGGKLLDYLQSNRVGLGCATHVLPPYRIAIHRRVGPGRDVQRTYYVFSQDSVERVIQRHPEGGLALNLAENRASRVRGGEKTGYGSMVSA